jgi:hypothetical protein
MKPDHSLKQEIIKEIMKVYPALPAEFYGHSLTTHVAFQIRTKFNKYPYEDTIMRYFRQLCEEGAIECECIHRKKSLYLKP